MQIKNPRNAGRKHSGITKKYGRFYLEESVCNYALAKKSKWVNETLKEQMKKEGIDIKQNDFVELIEKL